LWLFKQCNEKQENKETVKTAYSRIRW